MNRWNTAKKTNDKKRSLITKGTRDSGCVGKIRARSVHFPPLFLAEISSRNASYRYFRIGIRTSMFPSRLRPMFSVECFACTLRVVREYLDADRNFPIRAEVSMRSGDPTLIALLIAALTYIREVVCRRRSTRERHACVESDSAERKEKRTPRLERTATIFPFDLRGARTSAAGTHGARCTHTCSTPLLRGIKRS